MNGAFLQGPTLLKYRVGLLRRNCCQELPPLIPSSRAIFMQVCLMPRTCTLRRLAEKKRELLHRTVFICLAEWKDLTNT